MTDTVITAADEAPGASSSVPALQLLGTTGAVCVDGTCSFEPTVGADPQ